MDRINARHQLLQKFGGSAKIATAHAKAALVRSDIQSRLEEMGGFAWKVEMWPNWLQIWVDSTGNSDDDHRKTGKVADAWADRRLFLARARNRPARPCVLLLADHLLAAGGDGPPSITTP